MGTKILYKAQYKDYDGVNHYIYGHSLSGIKKALFNLDVLGSAKISRPDDIDFGTRFYKPRYHKRISN